MFRRMITALPICRKRTTILNEYRIYDKNKYLNLFSSGCFYKQAKRQCADGRLCYEKYDRW